MRCRKHAGTRVCHETYPPQDMSLTEKNWSFPLNEQARVVTRSSSCIGMARAQIDRQKPYDKISAPNYTICRQKKMKKCKTFFCFQFPGNSARRRLKGQSIPITADRKIMLDTASDMGNGKGEGRSGAGGGTRTLTHSRAADFESAASAISPLRQETNGAGEGNRTLVASLEGWSSAIELRPLNKKPSVLRMAHCLLLLT